METTQNLTTGASPATATTAVADAPAAVPQLGRSVTIQRAAEILGVSRRTVYYRISEGVLQTIRTRGGSQRVVVESLAGSRSKQQH
jgi:excisionase family DNA binding protein